MKYRTLKIWLSKILVMLMALMLLTLGNCEEEDCTICSKDEDCDGFFVNHNRWCSNANFSDGIKRCVSGDNTNKCGTN